MAGTGRLRRRISSALLWGFFFCLYFGGAAVLAVGLIFTGQTWWAVMGRHPSRALVFVKTAEVIFLSVGLLLALVMPFLGFRRNGRFKQRNAERRSGLKRQAAPRA